MAALEILALNTVTPQIQAPQTGDTYVANRDTSINASLDANSYRLNSSTIVSSASTVYNLSATDNGKVIYLTASSAITLTTASGLGVGFSCSIIQGGTGQVTVAQGSGSTLVSYQNLLRSAGQYAMISLVSPVANTFVATGQLTA
jgi:hypothetical protein